MRNVVNLLLVNSSIILWVLTTKTRKKLQEMSETCFFFSALNCMLNCGKMILCVSVRHDVVGSEQGVYLV